ncbi:hypothetical protein GCM10027168_25240 [Streptomyces capparidis]
MNDSTSLPIQALPDGSAELHLVLRLRWEDVAALGREAGRLATRLQRPVSLDEAAGHRLSSWAAATATPAAPRDRVESGGGASPALPSAAPAVASPAVPSVTAPAAQPAPTAASPVPAAAGQDVHHGEDRGGFDRSARVSSLAGRAP